MKKDIPFNNNFPSEGFPDPLELLILHRAYREITDGDIYDDEAWDCGNDMEESGRGAD